MAAFFREFTVLQEESGYDPGELAERMEVSRQTISKWESGATYPEMEKDIAVVRDVPMRYGYADQRRCDGVFCRR